MSLIETKNLTNLHDTRAVEAIELDLNFSNSTMFPWLKLRGNYQTLEVGHCTHIRPALSSGWLACTHIRPALSSGWLARTGPTHMLVGLTSPVRPRLPLRRSDGGAVLQ